MKFDRFRILSSIVHASAAAIFIALYVLIVEIFILSKTLAGVNINLSEGLIFILLALLFGYFNAYVIAKITNYLILFLCGVLLVFLFYSIPTLLIISDKHEAFSLIINVAILEFRGAPFMLSGIITMFIGRYLNKRLPNNLLKERDRADGAAP